MSQPHQSSSMILRSLRMALHGGFFLLLAIATLRLVLTRDAGTLTILAVAGAAVLATVYGLGAVLGRRQQPRIPALCWLAVVTLLWAALLAVSPDFTWVAFPLFFLHLHLLRGWHAVGAVGAMTAVVIAAQIAHAGLVTVAAVLGPTLGAAFAVVIAWGYAAIHAESEQRRRLIDDLTRTRAQLASSQHEAGVAAERERLAREIHDTLAQGLSSVVLLLRAAESALPGDPDSAARRIADARQTASDNLGEARQFVRDLSPPALAAGSLVDALQRLCEQTERETGIRCRLQVDGETVALSPDYEVALLRSAQASLANVGRHAGAAHAVVTLGFLDTAVTLDVYDDGKGFVPADDPQARAADGSGFGLRSLRDRVSALGGELEVESAPGEGAAVAVRLPLGEGQQR